ncbi:MAG: hypothetical protein II859_04120 [Bacteroidales bacterium]|nr:hypothetical protein [Bacteroidales bacterium]
MRIAPAEPQISAKGLQFAGFTPIQPLPSIKEVTAQTRTLAQQVVQQAQSANAATAPTPATTEPAQTTPSTVVEEPNISEEQIPPVAETETDETQTVTMSEETTEPTSEAPAEPETFEFCWNQMVDVIFAKKPAFYHQLRDYLPRFENEIIYVDVENDFQKNQLEMSKRAMLEYWRNQFKLNVNDIEFVIHEHERKKVIYTSEDKVNNMLEQNPELKDFLQVLNFRIKD